MLDDQRNANSERWVIPVNRKRSVASMKLDAVKDKKGEAPMKGLSGTLLALAFAFFSLISLLLISRSWESSLVPLADNERRVSELGFRFNLPR